MHEPVELSQEECKQLLRSGVVGRVAVAASDGPHVVPVNYSVVDDSVVIRTTPYSLLGSQGRSGVLAFEIDGFDHERQRGWSVVARGPAEVITDAEELARLRSEWEPRPWAAGARNLVLRIHWTELTGRQLGRHWDLAGSLPVRRTV